MSSMSQPPQATSSNVLGLMGVMFIGLKLTGYITWPWVWVLAPFWIPIAIILSVILACSVIIGIQKGIEDSQNARR